VNYPFNRVAELGPGLWNLCTGWSWSLQEVNNHMAPEGNV